MNVYIPIPCENAALDHLVDSVRQLMSLRLNVNKQAINLRELRELIVANIVSGRIDVRGLSIPEYVFQYPQSFAEGSSYKADSDEGRED